MFKFATKTEETMYAVFRIIVGFMFFFHGAQKVFGWFAKSGAQPLLSMMGIVGVFEMIVGILLFIGLWSRIGAVIGIILMIGAYFGVHVTSILFGGGFNNLLPIANNGELALLYLVSFLLIFAKGNGKASVERWLTGKERF